MTKRSAGLLLFRKKTRLEVFLVHPGGPFWAKKDAGVWSIPKGEHDEDEDALDAARREFTEETGFVADGPGPRRRDADQGHRTAFQSPGRQP